MKKLRKIGAIILAVTMLAVCATAWAADATLSNGVYGAFSPADTLAATTKTVKIVKELISDNSGDLAVFAPTLTYEYEITAGSADKAINDATSAHNPATSVATETKAGIVEGLDYTEEIILSPTGTNSTLAEGSNTWDIVIDFSGVVFSGYGVYRYVITEKPAGETAASDIADAYTAAGVTGANGSHIRYLDVYVKPSTDFVPLSDTKTAYVAGDWDIYGYVCFANDNDIDGTDSDSVTAAGKTNGFVSADTDGDGENDILPDTYYTYNLTVSKTLTGDNYSNSHEFPVHIDFTNADVTAGTMLDAVVTAPATDYTHTAVAASSLDGLAKIANGGSIKYVGIPCGTQVDVYETNDVSGATYATTLTVDDTAGGTKNITSTSTPSAFAAYSEQAYNSLQGTIDTTAADTADTVEHTIAIANVMRLISPTGLVVRYAPYGLILLGGITLLVIAMKRKGHKEEE